MIPVETASAPLPQPLPTWGRGGGSSVGLGAALVVLLPPSPLWGGLGRGALGQGNNQ